MKAEFEPPSRLPHSPQGPSASAPQGGSSEPLAGSKGMEFDAPAAMPVPGAYTASERQFLLGLARRALHSATLGAGALPEILAEGVAPKFIEHRACFVTLTRDGRLRGCVGQVLARAPLVHAVAATTRSAALCDPRFPPVCAAETPQLRIELSVLTKPQPLNFDSPEALLQQLRPREHGVVLCLGQRRATFLPQVWEQLPERVEFLNRLAEKAGGPPTAWRTGEVTVQVYQVEAFQEN